MLDANNQCYSEARLLPCLVTGFCLCLTWMGFDKCQVWLVDWESFCPLLWCRMFDALQTSHCLALVSDNKPLHDIKETLLLD